MHNAQKSHYIAYCRDEFDRADKHWWRYDDNRVNRVGTIKESNMVKEELTGLPVGPQGSNGVWTVEVMAYSRQKK